MTLGFSIKDQLELFEIPESQKFTSKHALFMRIQRVYGVNAIIYGYNCHDPDFVRLPIPQDEFKRIALILGEEEERLKLKAAC